MAWNWLKISNPEIVNNFNEGLPFYSNCIAHEKNLVENPNVDEPVIPFEIKKDFLFRKHLAYDLTPEVSKQIESFELLEHNYQQSRFQTRYQTDSTKKNHSIKIARFWEKKGHSISEDFSKKL